MKMMKKVVAIALTVACVATAFTGCGKKSGYESINSDVQGEITVMKWNGTGEFMQDLGHQDLKPEDFTSESESTMYAVAKAFNKVYPNVKINIYASNQGTENWNQQLEDFKAEHGKYPDVFSTLDLVSDVKRGMVADLSIFKDDPFYQSFNPALMNTMNYYGMQAGLPWYVVPFGVYVNRELAETNNIEVPPIDWNMDQYVDFVTSGDGKSYWGADWPATSFIETQTNSIYRKILAHKSGEAYVDLTSEEVEKMLSYIPKLAKHGLWAENEAGNIPVEVMEANGWWQYNFLTNNMLLTDADDPWMLGNAADSTEGAWGVMLSNDWDYYPRPSTEFAGNSVGINLDPIVIYNYAMNDGDPALSDEEYNQLKLTYTFTSFFVGSTDSWRAIADQTYVYDGAEINCLNDSMPCVVGDEFDKQMEIWYSTSKHKNLGDKEKKPGFQKIVELWKAGDIVAYGDKVYPSAVDENGEVIYAMSDWQSLGNKEALGAGIWEPNWLDTVKSKLGDWNERVNARFEKADLQMRESLKEFYGYTDDSFKTK